MKFSIKASTIWEYGQRKDEAGMPHQEDSLFPAHGKASASDRLFIICDGMGGHDAGEVASEAVCTAMAEAIAPAGAPTEDTFPVSRFTKALDKAFKALDRIDGDDRSKPGTTMAMLKLHADGATIAHIGDSRVYHIRPGHNADDTRILFMTSDHSLVNELVKLGELTPEQARTSPQRNVITRAMQPRLKDRPEADLHATSDIRPGDYFYLCSDGMLEQMDDTSIREIFSRAGGPIDKKTEILTRATEHNSDNHTAILVEITDVKQDAARPVTSIVTEKMSAEAREIKARMERENVAESVGVIKDIPSAGNNGSKTPDKNKSSNMWAWVAIVAIVAAALVWIFCFRDTSEDHSEASESADTTAIGTSEAIPDPEVIPEASNPDDFAPADPRSTQRPEERRQAPATEKPQEITQPALTPPTPPQPDNDPKANINEVKGNNENNPGKGSKSKPDPTPTDEGSKPQVRTI